MRFILTATLLLIAQPSYAEIFDTKEHCYRIENQANFLVEQSFESMSWIPKQPEKVRVLIEEAALYMERANDYAGVYSAFCK